MVSDGCANDCHQPSVLMSSAGRNEETSRPKVGTVQSSAITIETMVAVREVRRFRTRPDIVGSTAIAAGCEVDAVVIAVIGPPASAEGYGPGTRSAARPG